MSSNSQREIAVNLRYTVAKGVVVLMVLFGCGLGYPLILLLFGVFLLATGWIRFLARVIPEVEVSSGGIALGIVALIGLTAFGHLQLRSIRGRVPTWTWRTTFCGVLGSLAIAVAGLCFVGAGSELLWLTRADAVHVRISLGFYGQVKAVGRGFEIHLDQHDTYPGGTLGPGGQARHSWITQLLPSLDQAALARSIDLRVSWNDPRHRQAFETGIPEFRPHTGHRNDASGYALSQYASNILVLNPTQALRPDEITDGLAATILAGDVESRRRPWGHPWNCRDARLGLNASPDGFGDRSPYVMFLLADGSVRTLRESTDPRVLEALSTPNGHEDRALTDD